MHNPLQILIFFDTPMLSLFRPSMNKSSEKCAKFYSRARSPGTFHVAKPSKKFMPFTFAAQSRSNAVIELGFKPEYERRGRDSSENSHGIPPL